MSAHCAFRVGSRAQLPPTVAQLEHPNTHSSLSLTCEATSSLRASGAGASGGQGMCRHGVRGMRAGLTTAACSLNGSCIMMAAMPRWHGPGPPWSAPAARQEPCPSRASGTSDNSALQRLPRLRVAHLSPSQQGARGQPRSRGFQRAHEL